MSMKESVMHESCIENVEDYFMDRLCHLVDKTQIDDADAIHAEFVVDGAEPEDWLFINDLTNV